MSALGRKLPAAIPYYIVCHPELGSGSIAQAFPWCGCIRHCVDAVCEAGGTPTKFSMTEGLPLFLARVGQHHVDGVFGKAGAAFF
ncbi:hypothetical protein SAMN04488071_1771 [Kordiimonas lacus]|uniref:Uncharacterized protein n=1 Tax=Kordiimonas lacus TaxID=637679 RepID=A0A1G6YWS0_9PROT|nr:hypothetical protein SAMN04488071_1771 [Kordiimonas lacus]